MAFDRNRFKVTTSVTEQAVASTQEVSDAKNGSGRVYHRMSGDGKYMLRAFPAHDPSKNGFVQVVTRASLPAVFIVKDEAGNPTGETKVYNKQIFNARVHGGATRDIIEEYNKFVERKVSTEHKTKEAKKKAFKYLNGYRGADGKWVWGTQFNNSYMFYALMGGKIGLASFYEKQYKLLTVLDLTDDTDKPIGIDKVADPDDGRSFVFTKKGKSESITLSSFDPQNTPPAEIQEAYTKWVAANQLTDEQLQEWSDLDPLVEMYGSDVYTRRDFDLAIEGLRYFDSKDRSNYGIFEDEEFMKVIAEIAALYPEDEDEKARKGEDVKEMFANKDAKDAAGKATATEATETEGADLPFDNKEIDAEKLAKEEEIQRKVAEFKAQMEAGK